VRRFLILILIVLLISLLDLTLSSIPSNNLPRCVRTASRAG
jgi:hypothetical protein